MPYREAFNEWVQYILATGTPSAYSSSSIYIATGGSRFCGSWKVHRSSLWKRKPNYEYKTRYESENLFRAPPRAWKGPMQVRGSVA